MKKYIKKSDILVRTVSLGYSTTIEELQSLEKEVLSSIDNYNPNGYKITKSVIEVEHGYYEGEVDLVLSIYGEETDEQFNERIKIGDERLLKQRMVNQNRKKNANKK